MLAIAAVGLTVLVASFWAWALLIARKLRAPQLPLIPWTSRRAVPWALIDLILLAAVWILAPTLVRQILQNWSMLPREIRIDELTIEQNQAMLVGNIVAVLIILVNALLLIAFRTGASLRDFGIAPKQMLADVRLGVLGFILLAPPVYALQGVLVHVWKPSKHPLVEMFKESPDPLFFFVVFVSAALVAPLFEEIVFRVLLQGFLEKWFTFTTGIYELLIGGEPRHFAPMEIEHDGEAEAKDSGTTEYPAEIEPVAGLEPAVGLGPLPVVDPNPYAPPANTHLNAGNWLASGLKKPEELSGIQAWLPIVISSAIFALLHLPHGPDWIPLLFLAAGMGYLYQRTHRLVPSLTVHFLLNSYSLWGLWLQVSTAAK